MLNWLELIGWARYVTFFMFLTKVMEIYAIFQVDRACVALLYILKRLMLKELVP